MVKKIDKLPDTELEIMKVIWNNETPISTAQLKKYLDEKRPWNVSALQTLLNRLINRGFLKSYKQAKHRYYEVLIEKQDYIARENGYFLEKLNGNSITRFVTSLYESNAITNKDLEELALFIEEKSRGI
ncbi:BlaI/MecI/CopY family transcriptional regulator [Lachnoclostridium phytofermentans]|uniref:Transcriptional repressor, CopY family n=1 Tax=Lachnoclostridium phytofermentans (strain ATCC 700394 / DSM 18823 / ISDg) TaxID=357809 RepID=A9KII5_LACP7|nr:BlaI/MecI/CopY family transcriptional regulator [Lachnoclostridium phytofermentans]ABX42437.1 transcriptional repressor, CopY family [Lachnoclostridium phytofermentans ISDg]